MSDSIIVSQVVDNNIVVSQNEITSVITSCMQGPPGPPGVGGAAKFNFAFGDATPATLIAVEADILVSNIDINIREVFDGTGASITIGTLASPSLLVGTSDLDLKTLGTYEINPNYVTTEYTIFQLFITPGSGASTGKGTIFITYSLVG